MKAMKKLLSLFAAVVAVMLSSCSNDDIPVRQPITFKVNPSTVISGFNEYSPGELTVFPTNFMLRVRLLVYNNNGSLVASDTQTFSDYSHIMTSHQTLEEGAYTIVTLTDVITKTDDNFAWILSNEQSLTTLKLTQGEYIRHQLGILGLETKKVNISSSTTDISIDVKPAGALAFVLYGNWNQYSDVVYYKLITNKLSDNLSLNSEGEPQFSITSASTLKYRMSRVEWDKNYLGAYRYIFLFPMQNVYYQFACEADDEKTYTLGESALVNIEKGKEYYFSIDVETEETEWLDITPLAASELSDATPMGKTMFFEANDFGRLQFENGNCRVFDFSCDESLTGTIKPIDYLKQ